MSNELRKPDCLFEVSWEVCNKVGGIHTVTGTKALTVENKLGDSYILLGPDLTREDANLEFEEDPNLFQEWHKLVYNEGLRVRVGRWKVNGNPLVILVDFSSFISHKDEILASLWEDYKVDSISGGWDYVEPVLFGYAAAKVIESFVRFHCKNTDKVMAQFHEWQTGCGLLYLRRYIPGIASVFTTHATVAGRSIAGNGLPLYADLDKYNSDEMAARFNITAKHSLEKHTARNCDAFTTVSAITAHECHAMLGREVSVITPNGFDDSFVFQGEDYDNKRRHARELMIKVAETALDVKFDKEPLIVTTSGRYEFKNKGLDEFIDALGELNYNDELGRDILAYIMVPSWNHGPRKDLKDKLADPTVAAIDRQNLPNVTHELGDADNDPVVKRIIERGLHGVSNRVKVIFVPSYLNGNDGIFDTGYYEMLVGMDVTVFPSYYEPWGYTPLESIAFGIPTVTTTLTGFGLWVEDYTEGNHPGVTVIERNDYNNDYVVKSITDTLASYVNMPEEEMAALKQSAREISGIALWSNLFVHYEQAYDMAVGQLEERNKGIIRDGGASHEQVTFVKQQLMPQSSPSWVRLMIERSLPERLHPLEELTKNIWWSWNGQARQLFESINPEIWVEVERNPIALLDKLSYPDLKRLAEDAGFTSRMDAVYREFHEYMNEYDRIVQPRIAYFSMEYGLHASLKIYSGGLGILAGDYLKEASDKNVPMVAVGLLYRYGYFTQRLSNSGDQEASYEAQNFDKLPISPVRDDTGNWKTISVAFPGRDVVARLWRCDVGRTQLYLLDTDHDLNLAEDRSITYHLYGGDWENRLKQEFLLGIGGVRALDTLGLSSDVYHCNEGHAAFMGLERIRNFIYRSDLSFSEALEMVRSSSLFTTHTPVPAGHDAFPETMIRQYMSHYPERLKITWEQFISLGKTNPNDNNEKFSMSVLAANLSQEINGVSKLHGEVTKDIMSNMWPGYLPDELHIGYVTNGVHFPTWGASRLKDMYYRQFGEGFRAGDYSKENWDKIYQMDDKELWDARLYLKNRLVKLIRRRISDPTQFNFDMPRQLVQIKEQLEKDTLTIGFARCFATYKRANLLFTSLERLSAIVNNPARPVRFVFAGKAHPADQAGQDLIKHIVEISKREEFVGKIIFLQNYDMELARRMVQGVDVWLNTPTRPLEASGTSGEKAVMNGVMHFSVLDGWWVEGYKEGAGWMLPEENTYEDARFQDELDAEMIYSTIEENIIPLYFERDQDNIPRGWTQTIKSCIAEVASNFTTNRMMQDYQDRYYSKLYRRSSDLRANDFALAREIAAWKRRVSRSWDNLKVIETKKYDIGRSAIMMGEAYELEVTLDIDSLMPGDIGVEIVMADQIINNSVRIKNKIPLEIVEQNGSIVKYKVVAAPQFTGTYDVALRIYAWNDKLPHRMDFALVKWV